MLCFDTETTSLNPDEARLRVIGVRTNKSDKVYVLWKKDFEKFKRWALKADIVVTFNGDKYDIPVLCNEHNKMFKYQDSLSHERGKGIDLYQVVVKRESTFKPKNENNKFDNFTLDGVCDALGLERKVQDFDYGLLQKEEEDLTPEEKAIIEEYLIQDVNITWQLYEKMEEMFQPLAEFVPERDVRKKNYIKASMGGITYKVICHIAGLKTEYRNVEEGGDTYQGADVLGPYKESAIGSIECVDFASAYPHAYMHANLYTRCAFHYEDRECPLGKPCADCKHKFTGATTPDGRELKLYGAYCTYGGMGLLEKAIKCLFLMRLDAKTKMKVLKKRGKSDTEEYKALNNYQQALKIVINTIYGISGSERFVHTYNKDTAADCTLICRFNLNYMHARMAEAGYTVLYGDSVAGDTSIDIVGKGPTNIEELFTEVHHTDGEKEYCNLEGLSTPTITDKLTHTTKNVPYVMRHKVSKKMFRVWTSKTQYVDVTEDHSLIGLRGKELCEVKPTEIDCSLIGQKYFDNVCKNSNVPDIVHQFTGLFIGDGSFEINNGYKARNINISCGLDYESIEAKYFTPLIELGLIEYVKKHGDKGDYRVYGPITDYIRSMHLKDMSQKNFDISYMYGMPESSKCAMLRGLFDSDGTVMKCDSSPGIRFSNIHTGLCEQMVHLLREVGVHATNFTESKTNSYNGKCSGTYSSYVNITSKLDFKEKVGFDVVRKNERLSGIKSNGARHICDIVRLNVLKVEEIKYVDYVYDIEVEDTHRFFANGILVHNTDSAYVEDPYDDRDRIEAELLKIEADIKSLFPFPQDTFKIELEEPIEYIQWFKDRTQAGRYKKKMYLMLLKDGELKAKGLTVIKRDATGLAKLIWRRYIKAHIKEHKNCDVPKAMIDGWITDLLNEDMTNAAIDFKVKPVSEYANPNGLRAQISEKFGEGKHKMIKTTRENVGLGSSVKYVHVDEAVEMKFTIRDIDLKGVYSDLKDLTKDAQRNFDRFM